MWINPHRKCGTKPEGVKPYRIEFYKRTHYTSEKRWSSVEAETHYNNMIDLKDISASGEPSMTIDEIVDTVLRTKSGYIKGLSYGRKPNTTRATQRRMAELEYSLKKAKQEAVAETEVENQQSRILDQQSQIQDQQSQIKALNSQLDTVVARQEDMFRKIKLFAHSSSSRLEVMQTYMIFSI
ncbi:hypothetical protein H5410_021921 [Solanum commersonii]|uniref:Transposase n=1 Tax=Solanum commersonii TaxID=4109 RepID=A0A9J5ZFN2_SOLCO|nr:hypothetical protein H5410_021921 [Solanum commersonii]